MSDEATKLKAVGDFIGNLTPRSLLLGAIAGFVGIGLYQLFEVRAIAFTYIASTPGLLWALAGGGVLLATGWLVSHLLAKSEKFLMLRIDEQDKEIELLREELSVCREECRAGTAAMLASLHEGQKAILEKLDGISR